MASIRQQPYTERSHSLMKDSQGNARARARILSPLSICSTSGEIIANSPPELAAHIEPRLLPKATGHHAMKRLRQSTQPQGGQFRIVNGNPNPRAMASDHGPRYLPFYHEESFVNGVHDVRGPSRGNAELAQNMHQRQVYHAYAPKLSARQSERLSDDYRTKACLSHVHRLNNQTSRVHRQCYLDIDLTVDRAASRGFPILADKYRLDHRAYMHVAHPEQEKNHPHVRRMGKFKHPHASVAVPEAIIEPELTGSARLQQSFQTRIRVREPRSAMY